MNDSSRREELDTFLSYNSVDRSVVQQLADELSSRDIPVWLDHEQILAGSLSQPALETAIHQAKSAVIFWGPHGPGPWQEREIQALIRLAIERQIPVIPVLLPGAGDLDTMPLFLRDYTIVDLREGIARDKIDSLAAGIQGRPLPPTPPPDISKPSSPTPFATLLPGEWAVPEARQHADFVAVIHELYDVIRSSAQVTPDMEIVITLYARSFPEHGVGTFEYDLIYYRNIRNDAPMFGPTVKDDDRTRFVEENPNGHELSIVDKPGKPGGFVEREQIQSFAKLKLANNFWNEPQRAWSTPLTSEIVGLLFVNGRHFPIPAQAVQTDGIARLLSRLTLATDQVRQIRLKNYNTRRGHLWGLNLSDRIPRTRDLSPELIDKFFRYLEGTLKHVTGHDSLLLSVYLCRKRRGSQQKQLKWLWSNGPTSAPASIAVKSAASVERLFVADVANDPNSKPLLIHDLHTKPEAIRKTVRTHLGDASRAVLVVPVLSANATNVVGILEIEAPDGQQFDTDDVQLFYGLSRHGLSTALQRMGKADNAGTLPLRNPEPYAPFAKQPLGFPVHDLLSLNFNPMKFLLHWRLLRELIDTGITSSPATVEVWPNMICNHSCTWCRTESDRKRQNRPHLKREMTAEELRAIADDLRDHGDIDVLISGGGEPLLHPHIHEFLSRIADIDGTIGIFTNGTRPRDFRFWEDFFKRTDKHRFVRVSFNGHDPESYFRIHFDREQVLKLPPSHREKYAEARKILLDLLALRTAKTSVAIGDTIQHHELDAVPTKAGHADGMGVDFIQMRPELKESSDDPQKGIDVCTTVKTVAESYQDRSDFSVVHTDGERSFMQHTEPRCYAMQLVPTLVPDQEPGWTRVMPCSYAINTWGKVPNLGRMREGARLTDFWKQMNLKLNGGHPTDSDHEVQIDQPINPTKGCPQCRYFRLNQRIQNLADHKDKLDLIEQLVTGLNENPADVDPTLREEIEAVWPKQTIDIDLAMKVFQESQALDIVPSF